MNKYLYSSCWSHFPFDNSTFREILTRFAVFWWLWCWWLWSQQKAKVKTCSHLLLPNTENGVWNKQLHKRRSLYDFMYHSHHILILFIYFCIHFIPRYNFSLTASFYRNWLISSKNNQKKQHEDIGMAIHIFSSHRSYSFTTGGVPSPCQVNIDDVI